MSTTNIPDKHGLLGTLRHWAEGVRLYLAVGIGLITLQAWWWVNLSYVDNPDLAASRLHEVYGWLALILLAVTLSVGPLYRLAPNLGGKAIMRDARRLLGIGAAWFASLHAGIAYFVSFQAINLFDLSDLYKRAFIFGTVALVLLLLLALTSFNAAMKRLGVWWFRLHRTVYVAVVLVIWHSFSIGVHATTAQALAIIVGGALVLFTGHLIVLLQQEEAPSVWQVTTMAGLFLLIVILSNYGIQQYIDQIGLQGHLHR